MSSLSDLPDWTVGVQPLVHVAAQTQIAAGQALSIIADNLPIRIWAVWIEVSVATDGQFGAGNPQSWGATIQSTNGNILLRAECHMADNYQHESVALALPLNGFSPIAFGGIHEVELITDANINHIFVRCNAGVAWSQP